MTQIGEKRVMASPTRKTGRISALLAAELVEAVVAEARKERRSVANMVGVLLQDALASRAGR